MSKIAREIEERFFGLFKRNATKTDKPPTRISITEICGCLRRAYYQRIDPRPLDDKTAMILWIGQAIHSVPLLAHSEEKIVWPVNGLEIVGVIDEYEDGIIIEKKTCRSIPARPREEHARQAEYYTVLARKAGLSCKKALVFYIDVATPDARAFEIEVRPPGLVEREMIERATILSRALKRMEPPEREVLERACCYCPYKRECIMDG